MMAGAFRHVDVARTIVFGAGAVDDAEDLIGSGFTLLTTARASALVPALQGRANSTVHVPHGLVEDIAAELQARARAALERRDEEYAARYQELGISDDLAGLEGLTPGMLVTLGEKGIKTLDEFADLAGDELIEILSASDKGGVELDLDVANDMIMATRRHLGWFGDEDAEPAEKE